MNASVQTLITAYQRGLTMQEIGDLIGVSRQRVQQLLSARGVNRDTGVVSSLKDRRLALQEKQQEKQTS